MTPLLLTMPRLGETMEEGLIVGWMVAPGQTFRRGDPILELETDKTVVEFPALGDGMIDAFLAGPGDRIAVGAEIAQAQVANPADWADSNAAPQDEPAAAAAVSILRMPKLGETMEEGVIANWLIAEGAGYARGEAILEVETDKTVAEVPALYEGRLLRILAQPGEKLPVGAPIAEVDGRVEEVAAGAAASAPPAQDEKQAAAPAPVPRAAGGRLRATPLARRMARARGIALDGITGTGRRGRIERADVERAGVAVPEAADLNWLATPDGRVAYSVTGKGGQVFLLVHGFAGDRSAWAQLSAVIARAGHTAVALDLPGHGATEVEAVGLNALSDAVTRLAETLPGGLTLIGHSLGAAAAVAAAGPLGDKLARLLLLTPAGCGPQIGADFVHGMAGAESAGEVAHLLRMLGPKGGALSDAALQQMAADMAKGRLRSLASLLATSDGRQRIDILRPLGRLTMPVSALFGTEDQIVTASDALNLPMHVAAHFLPTGHMPQWDAPRELAEFILNGGRNG